MRRLSLVLLTLGLLIPVVSACSRSSDNASVAHLATASASPIAGSTPEFDRPVASPSPRHSTATPTDAAATATNPPAISPTTKAPDSIASEHQPAQELAPAATPWIPSRLPEDQQIDLPDVDMHYQVHLTDVRVETGFVQASETITLANFRESVPEQLYLQVVPAGYGFFTLDGLFLDGKPISATWINNGFTLVVPVPEGSKGPLEVGVDFHLNVGGPEPSGWGYIAHDADVLRLGYWLPQISDKHQFSLTLDPSYTRVAAFDVTLDLAAGIDFAHSGELLSAETLADGRKRYVMHGENIRDFDFAISAGYVMETAQSAGGVRIEYYWRPNSTPGNVEQVLATAVDALDRLTSLLGPYPWPTLRIADAGPSMPGGIEYGNLIYINPAYVPLERLIYHEATHMWFYGIIGTRTLVDGWVDEGGAEFFERGLPTGFTEIPAVPPGGYCCALDSVLEELPQSGNGAYYAIYEQGARFYDDVLETMGSDAFWQAMQQIYADFQFKIVTAYDLLALWQRHSPEDLRPLYDIYFRYNWIDDLPDPGVTTRQGWLPLNPATE